MELTHITTDQTVYWQWEFIKLNATIVNTWIVMGVLTVGSWLVTRRMRIEPPLSKFQNLLEVVVDFTRTEIADLSRQDPHRYLTFIGTLFLLIATANIMDLIPWFTSPAGSLSTTAGLAICVFTAVPLFGIADRGLPGYLKMYIQPTVMMLPFNIIGELSRTLALAVRLFGNVMSTAKIAGILLAIAPFFFPILMNALGLLTGLIQAYIFAILAMVYIASAGRARSETESEEGANQTE